MARKSSNDFFDVGTFWSIVKHLKKVDVKRRACTVILFTVVINKRVITTLYHSAEAECRSPSRMPKLKLHRSENVSMLKRQALFH